MEQFGLPLPELKYLASQAVVRSLVVMKVNNRYWCTNREDSLRKCELKIDKLPLPPVPREYVKKVLKGFFEQVLQWCGRNEGADILLDAYGNIDKRRTIRHDFQKCYKGVFNLEDFRPLTLFLEYLFWYYPHDCRKDLVSIILYLQEKNASIRRPEYRVVDEDLHVVLRFVNRCRLPPALHALLDWDGYSRPKISMEYDDILLTFKVDKKNYDEDLFRVHFNILRPSQRLQFVLRVLYSKMQVDLVQTLIRCFHVLDPETQRNSLWCLNENRFNYAAFLFMLCFLIPPFESLVIPRMELVGLNLEEEESYLNFFSEIVHTIDLIAFDDLLLNFWEIMPENEKTDFCAALEHDYRLRQDDIKEAMKKLSHTNMMLFQVLFDDLTVGLTSWTRHLRHVILGK